MAALKCVLSRPEISIVLRKIVELNFRTQRRLIKEYLLPLSAGDRVLDIGCGIGEFSALFPSTQYLGVDIDEPSLVLARRRFRREFVYADATRLPFNDASFSHALVVGVLHHMNDADAARALKEIGRVLKFGGQALIMEDTKSTNLLTRMMHALDQGSFVRTEREWAGLIGPQVSVQEHTTFMNGVCYYSAFIVTRP
ncbi:MAG: class I SAM-dependent methyltransferase [Patescibacteria group bacterium]